MHVKYTHDEAGRVTLVRNAGAGIAYEEYDSLRRPGLTRTYRYLPGTGLDEHRNFSPQLVHSRPRAILMALPAAGMTLPSGDVPDANGCTRKKRKARAEDAALAPLWHGCRPVEGAQRNLEQSTPAYTRKRSGAAYADEVPKAFGLARRAACHPAPRQDGERPSADARESPELRRSFAVSAGQDDSGWCGCGPRTRRVRCTRCVCAASGAGQPPSASSSGDPR